MKLREALGVLQVSFFFVCPQDNKSHHCVLSFKPTNVLKHLFCQDNATHQWTGLSDAGSGGVAWWSLEQEAGNKGDGDSQTATSGHTTRRLPACAQS